MVATSTQDFLILQHARLMLTCPGIPDHEFRCCAARPAEALNEVPPAERSPKVTSVAYDLSAVIASAEVLDGLGRPAAPLAQGFVLLSRKGVAEADLAQWSHKGPIAAVEAEFFGGDGTQWAAVWDAGELVLGPIILDEGEPFPPEGSPISQALRHIGVQRTATGDEFEAVGLTRHRYTEDWLR